MHALSYIGSDKEDGAEASWWGNHAGAITAHTLAIVDDMMALPADRDETEDPK